MLKILHTLPDLHMGGVANLLLKLLPHWEHSDFEHHLCYFGDNEELLELFEKQKVRIHKIKYKGPLGLPVLSWEFKNLIIKNGIDVVHSNLFLDRIIVGLSSFFLKIPIVISIHTTNTINQQPSFKGKIYILLEDFMAKITATRFIAVSDTVKGIAVKHRMVEEKKIETLYSGVSIPKFKLRKFVCKDRLELISVGRLVESKGMDNLLEILNELIRKKYDARLRILGDGPQRQYLENRTKELKLEPFVEYLGYSKNVSFYLEQADVFVTCTGEEGFGLSLVEAMAHSLPVIAYSIPIFEEISGDSKALLLTPLNNKNLFADSIKHLCESAELYEEYALKSYKRSSEKFNIKNCAEDYLNFYSQLNFKNND